MKLNEIFENCNIETYGEISDLEAEELSLKSDENLKNKVYFCFSKNFYDTYEKCYQALKNEAIVVVSNFAIPLADAVKADDARHVFAIAAKNLYHKVCDDLKIVGITGTNGKTSTSQIVAQILNYNGRKAGVIGTNGVYYNNQRFECPLTTPDANFLHKTFYEMKNAGVEYVIMEVSAHAIDQKRIDGINFEIGVLTNITQDHLDYFETMENYEKTKFSFFTSEHVKEGLVCLDDSCAAKLLMCCNVPLKTYGLTKTADSTIKDESMSLDGSEFIANINNNFMFTKTKLIGNYNLYNSLAALAVCQRLGLSCRELSRGISRVEPIEGRFNVLKVQDKYVVVDYAHTPDGLYNILKAVREVCFGKVILVFGCGGHRDKTKRPIMGKIAGMYSDWVCLTSDNPRDENPEDIIKDIQKGLSKSHMHNPDRKKAIFAALDFADKGDCVIIAGKGAEKYQEINEIKYPFSDFDVVNEYIRINNFSKAKIDKEK